MKSKEKSAATDFLFSPPSFKSSEYGVSQLPTPCWGHRVVSKLTSTGVPESPRYLIANDKLDEAMMMLAKYHANGNVEHPTVKFEYREITETIKMEQAGKEHSSYLDFFRTPGNRYQLMILVSLGIFSQWSGNAIISNYTNILYENAGISGSTERLGVSLDS